MSEEEEKKVPVEEAESRDIESRYPRDIFRTFDDMWNEFRRDFLIPRRSRVLRSRPWWRRELFDKREACTDLIDTSEGYKVCAEVPGIPKDKIDITISKNGIEISAKVETERKEEEKGYVVRERGYSEVYKKMSFPEEVIPDKAEATIKNGLLEVSIQKKTPTPEPEKYKVKIK
jgi:HSP20 family protein